MITELQQQLATAQYTLRARPPTIECPALAEAQPVAAPSVFDDKQTFSSEFAESVAVRKGRREMYDAFKLEMLELCQFRGCGLNIPAYLIVEGRIK